MRSLCLAAAIASTLPACSIFMHSIEKPSATVRQVSVTSASFAGATGELALDIVNPNGFSVPLSGIDWQLSIGGSRAVTGSVQLSQTIPAKGAAPVVTTLTIDARDAVAVAGALASGVRDYQIDVKLHFSTQVGNVDVAVAHTGQLASSLALR